MRKLLKRTVKTAVKMELVELAVQAVDGTKVRSERGKGPDLRRRRATPSAGPVGRDHRRVGSTERGGG